MNRITLKINQIFQTELKKTIKIFNNVKLEIQKMTELQPNQHESSFNLNETLNELGKILNKMSMQAKMHQVPEQCNLNSITYTDISKLGSSSVSLKKCYDVIRYEFPSSTDLSDSSIDDEYHSTYESDADDEYETASESDSSIDDEYEAASDGSTEDEYEITIESEYTNPMSNEHFAIDTGNQNEMQMLKDKMQKSKITELCQKNQKLILIEGNIGAGKTTLLNFFRKFENVQTINEPVEDWSNLNGTNLLKLMYEDPKTWTFPFQSYVLLTYLKIHLTKTNKITMMERSIYSARICFIEYMYEKKKLKKEEYDILQEWYRFAEQNFDLVPDLIIYLRTSPEKAFYRCVNRYRPEERELSFQHFRDLHNYHEEWLLKDTNVPVLVLDGDAEGDLIESEYEKCLRHLHINDSNEED